VFLSNSGASCVMAADYAEMHGIPLAPLTAQGKDALRKVLPAFAGLENPIDITGALLTNAKLFGAVLSAVGEDAQSDLVLAALPIAGAGYDVGMFAADLAAFDRRYGLASALASPQEAVRAEFAKLGVATFAAEGEAMDALAQVAGHAALLGKKPLVSRKAFSFKAGKTRFLSEAESLAMLAGAGIPVVEHRLCRTEQAAAEACSAFGAAVMKVCSPDVPHKSDHGLVALEPADPGAEFRRQRERCLALGARFEGVIVARRAAKGRELALGARLDPQFGPVVLVGDGGIYLEALKDFRLLLPPFAEEEVLAKLNDLHVAPLLGAVRGAPARDTSAFARMAVRLGEAMLGWSGQVASVDVNPVMVFETGRGALALDALIERAL